MKIAGNTRHIARSSIRAQSCIFVIQIEHAMEGFEIAAVTKNQGRTK